MKVVLSKSDAGSKGKEARGMSRFYILDNGCVVNVGLRSSLVGEARSETTQSSA